MKLSKILGLLALAIFSENQAQNYLNYNVGNAHSHNDYMQEIPFWQAYYANFGSIEADVFLVKGKLWVAHTEKELSADRTLESLYLDNISKQIKLNKGNIYKDTSKKLQLLIDIKQDYKTTLAALVNTLKKYPEITGNSGVKIVITGGRPQPADFKNYPSYLYFDGDLNKDYSADQLKRIGMFSADLPELVKWNGKGIPRDEETEKIKRAVDKAHTQQKPMRFYGAPDFPNAWVNLMDMGADYINTDHIPDLKKFMNTIPKNFYKNTKEYVTYTPTYKTDGVSKKVKNVILLIPDGTSLPQYYAAFTANKGKLNVFKIPVSVTYLTGRVLLIGAISASPMFLSQKKDSLKEKSIDEIVVVGYGTQKKSKVSGAVTEASLDKLTSRSLSGVGEVLQGKAPGVTVVNEGGDPNGSPKVNIRGLGGINGETPLYVVDGVVFNGTPSINPNDIQDISVLKDASAAIYGARSSGGVILITTKRGKKGNLTVDFDVKYGINQAWRLKESLNAAEFQDVMYQAFSNVGKLESLPKAFNPALYPEGRITRTDWMKEIFRTGTIQEYNMNLSGGNEKSRYFVGMNHRNLEGILLNTQAKRYNFRVNSEHKIKDWLTIGENMYYNYSDGNTADTKSGYTGAVVAAMYYPPNVPVYTPAGAFSGLPISVAGGYGDMINPVAYLKRINLRNPTHEILINPYAEITLAKDLKFRSNFSQTFKLGNVKNFTYRVLEVGKIFDTNNLEYQSNNSSTALAEQLLTYKITAGKHNFDFLGGFTFQKTIEEGFLARSYDFRSEAEVFQHLQNAADTNKEVSSYKYKQALVSYLARVNYDYAGKYILSVLGRRDGSSLVAKQNRFANYYALSGAWVVSKEDFMQNISWLSSLKLRGSYGILGNLGGISPQAVNPLMTRDNNIIFGQNPSQNIAYYATTRPNPDLKWGKSEQTSFGVDASFLHNSLSLQFDYFVKNSKDQIFNVSLPSTSTYNNQYVNAGLFQDKGYELGINYNSKKSGDFTYSIGATFSQLKNTVKQLADVDEIFINDNGVRGVLKPTRVKIGDPLYSFYGYKTGGIFQSQDEINNYRDANGQLIQPNAKPGDIKFLKKEGNTGVLSNKDFVNLGSPYPKFSYGFSYNMTWKNFDLNVFFQGVYGNKIFNGLKFISLNPGGTGQNYNMERDILNAWTPQNTNTNIPRLAQGDPSGNYSKVSDFYVEDGSYLRLKNLTIGYSLPSELYRKLDVNKVRIYITTNNLFTITKYTGFDPEVGMNSYGVDTGRYPQARSFIFGVEVGL